MDLTQTGDRKDSFDHGFLITFDFCPKLESEQFVLMGIKEMTHFKSALIRPEKWIHADELRSFLPFLKMASRYESLQADKLPKMN